MDLSQFSLAKSDGNAALLLTLRATDVSQQLFIFERLRLLFVFYIVLLNHSHTLQLLNTQR